MRNGRAASGFTLIELLVVLACLALLSTLILPGLAARQPMTQTMQCGNNLRQLSLGWLMYAQDNAERVVSPVNAVGGIMDWTSASNNTNAALLFDPASSALASYIKGPTNVYKCPADVYQSAANPGTRVRSYSLDGLLGGTSKNIVNQFSGRTYFVVQKLTDLAAGVRGPSTVFLWVDEHPDSLNDAVFYENAGEPGGAEKWGDLPASYHNGSGGLSFMDGHVIFKKWTDARTVVPVMFIPWTSHPEYGANLSVNLDYEFVDNAMPYR